MRLISHPFRLSATGQVATVDQDSTQAAAEQFSMFILTETGERVLIPAFGITPLTFNDFDPADIILGLSLYAPSVSLSNADVTYEEDGTVNITLEFDND